jgi:hypothetical protein
MVRQGETNRQGCHEQEACPVLVHEIKLTLVGSHGDFRVADRSAGRLIVDPTSGLRVAPARSICLGSFSFVTSSLAIPW